MQPILAFYATASIVTFIIYAIDKSAACSANRTVQGKKRSRVPENTLHLLSLAGGWPGALAAQSLLRHKTRKQPFQTVFWITVVLHCALSGWLLLRAA